MTFRLVAKASLIEPTDSLSGYPEFNGTYNVECFDTYNPKLPTFSDISVDNAYDRQWNWFLCAGFGW